jgi:hypothetical protein
MRTAVPKSFLAYYPALYPQNALEEFVVMIESGVDGEISIAKTIPAGHPPRYEPLGPRNSYDTSDPIDTTALGPITQISLGDIALARSGDKGSNLNCGIFVKDSSLWNWFRGFLSRQRIIQLLGEDWKDEYFLERVEFPKIHAVHFVIYGILGRGVSGSTRLDSLGKGFADYFRDKFVEVPLDLPHSEKR